MAGLLIRNAGISILGLDQEGAPNVGDTTKLGKYSFARARLE